MRRLTDPGGRRGVRPPFSGLLSLTLSGLLCRQPEFLSTARWAGDHWDQFKGPRGFTRGYARQNTTLSRACARFSIAQFRQALFGRGRIGTG